MRVATAATLRLGACPICGLVSRTAPRTGGQACPRCGARLRLVDGDASLARTTGLLAAAALLFVPANLLPIMTTVSIGRRHSDTILSGVAALWRAGAWPLSILVLVASLAVPALKLVVLGLLVMTARRRSTWRPRARTRLYRLIARVGRWSMLDIFVMALLAALVRSPVAGVEIGPGAAVFAAVVVLTMLATEAFDPRLIWAEPEAGAWRAP
ncbi:MAG TPA: paraquat-inducible protein A [Polyangia bacterium]